MITKYWMEVQSDGEFYCGVVTEGGGGDKDWGPYYSQEEGLRLLRNMVENTYDEEWDESKLEVINVPDDRL